MPQELSENGKVIALLCARLGNDIFQPLTPGEYSKIVEWLISKKLQPADLLSLKEYPELSAATGIISDRLQFLLGRGFQLGVMLDNWHQAGISIITRSDAGYPSRFKKHLHKSAPPLLYYVGNLSLAEYGGVAVVGSRSVDDAASEYAKTIAEKCAEEKKYVISGGAKGVDQISVASSLNSGGRAVCVVADSLFQKCLQPDTRQAVCSERLLLLSPYSPDVSFNVGNAMGRNKLIYALADFAIVVNCEYNKGGSWSGAVEELRHPNAIPVFVRDEDSIPEGNKKLMGKGAVSLSTWNKKSPLFETLTFLANENKKEPSQTDLFNVPKNDPVIENEQSRLDVSKNQDEEIVSKKTDLVSLDIGKTTEVKKDIVDNTETPFSLSSAPEEPVKRKSKSSKNAKKKKSKKEEMSDSSSEQGSFSFDR